jgi:hypothetical protein
MRQGHTLAITQPFHIRGRPHQEFACCLLCSLRYLRIFSRILLHSLLTNDSSQRLIILHTHGLFNEIYKPCETNKIIDIILLTYKRCLTMRRVFHKPICLLYNSLKQQQQTSILVLNKLDSLDIKLIGDKKNRDKNTREGKGKKDRMAIKKQTGSVENVMVWKKENKLLMCRVVSFFSNLTICVNTKKKARDNIVDFLT